MMISAMIMHKTGVNLIFMFFLNIYSNQLIVKKDKSLNNSPMMLDNIKIINFYS